MSKKSERERDRSGKKEGRKEKKAKSKLRKNTKIARAQPAKFN